MRGIVLFNYNYLYQGADIEFHIQMLNLGLHRGNPLICVEHRLKCIMATKYEYFLVSYDETGKFLDKENYVATYTPEDFIEAIKAEYGKGNT